MRQGSLFALIGDDAELVMVFEDNDEERFLQALACGVCGLVRLAVDYDTVVEG